MPTATVTPALIQNMEMLLEERDAAMELYIATGSPNHERHARDCNRRIDAVIEARKAGMSKPPVGVRGAR